MKIAVFGGSFDPPHIGHEKIALEAIQWLDIDKLIIVPTFLNPFKSSCLFSSKNRLSLIKKLFLDCEKIDICEYEINQQKPINTVETVEYIKKLYKPSLIYLIIGTDNFKLIHTWYKYDTLKNLVEFVIAKRGIHNHNFEDNKHLDININVNSTQLRHTLNLHYIPKKIQNYVNDIWHNKKVL